MDIFLGVEDFQVVLPPQKNGTALPLVLEAGHKCHITGCKLKWKWWWVILMMALTMMLMMNVNQHQLGVNLGGGYYLGGDGVGGKMADPEVQT